MIRPVKRQDAAIIARMWRAFGIHARKTFSGAYAEKEFNESDLAVQASRELGSEHHVEKIGPDEYLGIVNEAMGCRPAPTGDASYIALFLARGL